MLSLFILVGCGGLIAMQGTMNAALGRSLGLPLFAVVFSALQLIFCFPGLLVGGWSGKVGQILSTPIWQFVGPMLGVVILWGMAFGMTQLGTFTSLVALLVGQLILGLIIDHFGFFGAPVNAVSMTRVLALVFVIIGAWLAKL